MTSTVAERTPCSAPDGPASASRASTVTSRIATMSSRNLRLMSATAIFDLPVYRGVAAVSHRRSLLRTQAARHF
jgi:hypothetical protein